MPEVEVKTVRDLMKFRGWTIKDVMVQGGVPPVVSLILSYPAAEHDVCIIFQPIVKLGRSGNVLTCAEDLMIQVKDEVLPA